MNIKKPFGIRTITIVHENPVKSKNSYQQGQISKYGPSLKRAVFWPWAVYTTCMRRFVFNNGIQYSKDKGYVMDSIP